MALGPDPLVVLAFFIAVLSVSWLFAMDIQHRLWNWTEKVRGEVPRRHSGPNFHYSEAGEESSRPSTPEPEGSNSWSLLDRFTPARLGSLNQADAGHFTEEEFLQRFAGGEAEQDEKPEPLPDKVAPEHMRPGNHSPELSEPSALLDERECRALAAAVPIRHRWRRWYLLYSTGRDGISLQTLYRAGSKHGPSILVVRDRGNHVFGCFCAEGWKVAPRYYGNGESFVFQIQPEMVLWRWYQKRMALGRNDFFQYGTHDCLALGGAPAYAFKLDGDLVYGRSGVSETFGNSPLASSEEFEIGRVELWGLI